jgi:hypothetical protein
MRVHGRACIRDFLGNSIVYRRLDPLDLRLPRLAAVSDRLGLPPGVIPRKSTPEYANVIALILGHARKLEAAGGEIERLVYVGDTRISDESAFLNICRVTGWRGAAFIASENEEPPQQEVVDHKDGMVFLSNRWATIADFDRFCRKEGIGIDYSTAVVIDLDKTALGARGRNDRVIDSVRQEAMRSTILDLLGDRLDERSLAETYEEFNRSRFHPFTCDNQDYLAYACLIVESGLLARDRLVAMIEAGKIGDFGDLLLFVDQREASLPDKLRRIHRQVRAAVVRGDPTPFVEFRRTEYKLTADRMGCLDDDAPIDRLLGEEIVITHEVLESALRWRDEGALLFGLSDKPDEASIPTADLSSQGYRPIHDTTTHVIGG